MRPKTFIPVKSALWTLVALGVIAAAFSIVLDVSAHAPLQRLNAQSQALTLKFTQAAT